MIAREEDCDSACAIALFEKGSGSVKSQVSEKIVFVSDTFQLDGIISQGASLNGKGALILHPHPLYGGDMYNPVVTSLEKTLLEVGYTTLRFNFRGTSFSPEGYAGVAGSVIDSRCALDTFESKGIEQIGFVGYSYGGSTALRLASKDSPLFLITLSASRGLVTEGNFDETNLEKLMCPTLMFHGLEDKVAPLDDLRTLSKLIGTEEVETMVFDGEGHFYRSSLNDVSSRVRLFLDQFN